MGAFFGIVRPGSVLLAGSVASLEGSTWRRKGGSRDSLDHPIRRRAGRSSATDPRQPTLSPISARLRWTRLVGNWLRRVVAHIRRRPTDPDSVETGCRAGSRSRRGPSSCSVRTLWCRTSSRIARKTPISADLCVPAAEHLRERDTRRARAAAGESAACTRGSACRRRRCSTAVTRDCRA